MSKGMDNFRQAARELFGDDSPFKGESASKDFPGQEEGPAPQPAPAAPSEQQNDSFYTSAHEPEPAYDPASVGHVVDAVQEKHGSSAAYAPEPEVHAELRAYEPPKEISVISKGTIIKGRVITDGHLEVRGRVDGDINADGNVRISGKVSGSIKGDYVELLSTQIRGNLNADSGILINSESIVVGDIKTNYVVFDGKIKGDIVAEDSVTLNSNAFLVGNIVAQSVSIDSGAVINGNIKTSSRVDVESLFDFV